MPRPMYFASFAKKVFLRAGRAGSAVTSRAHARWCARRVCGAQLVFCQGPDHGDRCLCGVASAQNSDWAKVRGVKTELLGRT